MKKETKLIDLITEIKLLGNPETSTMNEEKKTATLTFNFLSGTKVNEISKLMEKNKKNGWFYHYMPLGGLIQMNIHYHIY